jgi:hypothetical protein
VRDLHKSDWEQDPVLEVERTGQRKMSFELGREMTDNDCMHGGLVLTLICGSRYKLAAVMFLEVDVGGRAMVSSESRFASSRRRTASSSPSPNPSFPKIHTLLTSRPESFYP